MRVEERRLWGLWRRSYRRRYGFYTTRFVQTTSPEEAAEEAESMVVEEINHLNANAPDQPWRSAVEKIVEWDPVPSIAMPGAGFTWYAQDDEQNDAGEDRP